MGSPFKLTIEQGFIYEQYLPEQRYSRYQDACSFQCSVDIYCTGEICVDKNNPTTNHLG
jgi:hypothetical protein